MKLLFALWMLLLSACLGMAAPAPGTYIVPSFFTTNGAKIYGAGGVLVSSNPTTGIYLIDGSGISGTGSITNVSDAATDGLSLIYTSNNFTIKLVTFTAGSSIWITNNGTNLVIAGHSTNGLATISYVDASLNTMSNVFVVRLDNKVDELNGVATNLNTFGMTNQGPVNLSGLVTNHGAYTGKGQTRIWDNFFVGAAGADLFKVDASIGNLEIIRGVTDYIWPAAHSSGALTNDGAGILGWLPFPTGGASLGIVTNNGSGTNNVFTGPLLYQAVATNSAAANVPFKVMSIASVTANIAEFWSNATLQAYFRSNFTFHVPLGSATDVSLGNNGSINTGIFFPASSTVSISAQGGELVRFENNTGRGVNIQTGLPLTFGAAGGPDVKFFREQPANFSQRDSTIPQTNNLFGTYTSFTSGEKLEKGYNGTHSWFFVQSNTNGAGTLRPLALGVTTNASIVIDATRGVTIKAAQTNTVGLSIGPSGTLITNILTASANLDFPSTLGQTHADLSIALTGTGTNDVVALGAPINAMQVAGCVYMAYPSNDTVWVRFLNSGVTAKDPDAGVFKVKVTKF
jgi:hypothetical protein